MVFALCWIAGSNLAYAKAPGGCMDDCVSALESCIKGGEIFYVSQYDEDYSYEYSYGEATRDNGAAICAGFMKRCVIGCAPGKPERD